jgi:hypothetical protein
MTNTHHHLIWIVEDDLDDRILLNEAFKDTQIRVQFFYSQMRSLHFRNWAPVRQLKFLTLLLRITTCM